MNLNYFSKKFLINNTSKVEKVQVEKPEVQLEEEYEIVEEDTLDLDLEYILNDEDFED